MLADIKKGQIIIITSNPHFSKETYIRGVVVKYRPGEGFGGVDIVEVEFSTQDGIKHVRPFGLSHLMELSYKAVH